MSESRVETTPQSRQSLAGPSGGHILNNAYGGESEHRRFTPDPDCDVERISAGILRNDTGYCWDVSHSVRVARSRYMNPGREARRVRTLVNFDSRNRSAVKSIGKLRRGC
jgi:hypothetical protein